MKKLELIYRHILHLHFTEKKHNFTQKELAETLKCSVSTVFHALQKPRRMGAVRVTGRDFVLADAEKLLTYWATLRRSDRDVLYKTHAEGTALRREALMPPGVIFGAYSAYRFCYGETPADYDTVVVYAPSSELVQRRFPSQKGPVNLWVFKADPFLAAYGPFTPPVQIYVDLWNSPQWYAQDFRKALHQRLFT